MALILYFMVAKSILVTIESTTQKHIKLLNLPFPMGLQDLVHGVLPSQEIKEAIQEGWIDIKYSEEVEKKIQPASMDATIEDRCVRVPHGFRPAVGQTIEKALKRLSKHDKKEYDISNDFLIQQGFSWYFPIKGTYRLPKGFWLKSSPKSTQGRLGNFVRMIADGIPNYDEIKDPFEGKIGVIVQPRVFSAVVRPDISFNQLRWFYGIETKLPHNDLVREYLKHDLLYLNNGAVPLREINPDTGLPLSLDLEGEFTDGLIGFKARRTHEAVPLYAVREIPFEDFFEEVRKPKEGRLILGPLDKLYLLASRERVRVPPHLAAELEAYETKHGELRFHEAGFFDPGFGHGENGDIQGSSAVLEIHSKETEPYPLVHGQGVSSLYFEWLRQIPDKVYGPKIGSTYQNQIGAMVAKPFTVPKELQN